MDGSEFYSYSLMRRRTASCIASVLSLKGPVSTISSSLSFKSSPRRTDTVAILPSVIQNVVYTYKEPCFCLTELGYFSSFRKESRVSCLELNILQFERIRG